MNITNTPFLYQKPNVMFQRKNQKKNVNTTSTIPLEKILDNKKEAGSSFIFQNIFYPSKAQFEKQINLMTRTNGWGEKIPRFFDYEKKELLQNYNKNRGLMLFLVNQKELNSDEPRFLGENIVDLFNIASQSNENENLLKKYMQKKDGIKYRFNDPELIFLLKESAKSKENKDLVEHLVDDEKESNIHGKKIIDPTYNFYYIRRIMNYYNKDKRIADVIKMKDSRIFNKNFFNDIINHKIPMDVPFFAQDIAKENDMKKYSLEIGSKKYENDIYEIKSDEISNIKGQSVFTHVEFDSHGKIIQKYKSTYKFRPIRVSNMITSNPENTIETTFIYDNKKDIDDSNTITEVKDKQNNTLFKEHRFPSIYAGLGDKFNLSREDASGISELISSVEKSESGLNIIEKNFNHDDGTKSNYLYVENPKGERYSYTKITDSDNIKVLAENNQKFKIIDENHFESEENGTKYDIQYYDDKVVCTNSRGKKVTIPIGKKGVIDKNIVPLTKQLPGSMYFKIADCELNEVSIIGKLRAFNENVKTSVYRVTPPKKKVYIAEDDSDELFTLLHELGHAIDDKKDINSNVELNNIYETERDEFLKKVKYEDYENMNYFLEYKDKSLKDSLQEMIAETNALLYSTNHCSRIERRGELLQQHFPKSFAKIVQLLYVNDLMLEIF